jgi:hypothetical protein
MKTPSLSPRRLATIALALPALFGLAACEGAVDTAESRPADDATDCPYDLEKRVHIAAAVDAPFFDGQCLPEAPATTASGEADCVVLDFRRADGACECGSPGFRATTPEHEGALAQARAEGLAPADADCICEVAPMGDAEQRVACENGASSGDGGEPLDGYCYVDPTADPPRGAEDVVAHCPSDEPRELHFVGAASRSESVDRTIVMLCRTHTCVE